MNQNTPIPRCLGLFPNGDPCPYRKGCLHYTEGTDQLKVKWEPRIEGNHCFDLETEIGVSIGYIQ